MDRLRLSIGRLCIVIAIGLGIKAFTMDTSVAVDYPSGNPFNLPGRVNNLGLMSEKQNFLIAAGVLLIVGIAIIYIANQMYNQQKQKQQVTSVSLETNKGELMSQLAQLHELKEKNVITQDIYESQRLAILEQLDKK